MQRLRPLILPSPPPHTHNLDGKLNHRSVTLHFICYSVVTVNSLLTDTSKRRTPCVDPRRVSVIRGGSVAEWLGRRT